MRESRCVKATRSGTERIFWLGNEGSEEPVSAMLYRLTGESWLQAVEGLTAWEC